MSKTDAKKPAKKPSKKLAKQAKKLAKQAAEAAQAAAPTVATPAAERALEWNKQEKKRFERKMNKAIVHLDKLAKRHAAPELQHIASRLVYIRNVPHEYIGTGAHGAGIDTGTVTPAAPTTTNASGAHSPAGRSFARA